MPPSHDPNPIDAVVSHAHNALIVATPTVYPNDVRAMIEQAVAYHKRLFVIVPLGPGGPVSLGALCDLFQAEGVSMWDLHNDCPPDADLGIALSRATAACDNKGWQGDRLTR